jgi:hypothetical protein
MDETLLTDYNELGLDLRQIGDDIIRRNIISSSVSGRFLNGYILFWKYMIIICHVTARL